MKLFCPPGDLHAQKILVTAAFADTQISCTNLGKEGQKKHTSPSVLFPRITPSLQTETGIYLSGSNTICRYLARSRNDKKLYGQTLEEQGEVDMWLDFCVHEIETPLLAAAAAAAGCAAAAAAAAAASQSAVASKAKADIGESVKLINNHLKLRTYMVGERITIADICLSVVLSAAAKKFGAELFKPFSEINRWKETICNQKSFKKVAPDCCSSSSSSSSSSGSSRPRSAAAASGSKGKPAAAAGKPAAAAAAADEDDAAAAGAGEAKPKCELDLLPPSPFDLNEWKRVYSNTKNLRGEALPWLWKNFDGKGFCFYYMKYEKLEGECTVAFLTSNQLGGFLQRVDNNFRKYSFAVINVVGKDNVFDIQGVWMFRGLGIPQMIKEHPSFEYNTWTPLDYNKPKDKKLIEDYFCNDDEVENRPIADCKVWK